MQRARLVDAARRAAGVGAGVIVLLGDPSLTGPAWAAALAPPPAPWRWIWRPRDGAELVATLRSAGGLEPWTVVRLPDLRRFLLSDDDALAVEVISALRAALRTPTRRPLLVAASMPADVERWRLLTRAPASGGVDRWSQARALLHHAVVLTAAGPPASHPLAGPSAPTVTSRPGVRASGLAPAPSHPVPPPHPVPPSASAPEEAARAQTARAQTGPEETGPAETGPAETGPAETGPAAEVPGPTWPVSNWPGWGPVPLPGERFAPDPWTPPVETAPSAGAAPPAGSSGGSAPESRSAAESTVEPGPSREVSPEEASGVDWTPRPAPPRRPRGPEPEQSARLWWRPEARPDQGEPGESTTALLERGIELERAGNLEAAERVFERAAQVGDLAALARLAALRRGPAPTPARAPDTGSDVGSDAGSDAAADAMYEAAAAEGNTAVLFALAAAGHRRALLLLTRLREETHRTA